MIIGDVSPTSVKRKNPIIIGRARSLLALLVWTIAGSPASLADQIRVEAESQPVELHRPGARPSEPIVADVRIEASAVDADSFVRIIKERTAPLKSVAFAYEGE